ncbi:PF11268 family protein [Actinomyces sp. ICM39]|uniref:septation protein SepH n=1 Tax=Actinomyces sp. ICM39 TaxID=1105029 RepID=UPI0002770C8E|nr:septation protein SepH [Actinomyces sp. ICM39]EJN45448.1 PF11268 family protein [Actinomyces sp. ICM39]
MIELELLGTSADGESLVLTDAQGERYSVLISDELRGATRRDRPRVELAPARPTLAPRDIQALLRAGATPQEIASEHGMEVSAVERFEAPVQAEKDYALTRARAVRVGEGGPTMGDLVVDRLAARGVDPASLEWSATREAGEPWQIIVTFVQGAAEHAAHWHLSNSGSLEAIDQEAQWLTEQVSVSPTASIFTPLPRTAPTPDPDEEDLRNREAIVDQLNAVRGKRQQIDLDLDDEVDEEAEYLAAIAGEDEPEVTEPDTSTGPISARIYSLASARTKSEAPAQTSEDALFPATGQIPSARPAATGSIPVASRSQKNEAPASSGVLPWLSDTPASSEDDTADEPKAEEQSTSAIPMKAVAPVDTAPAKAEEGATGAVPSQGVTGSRMARASSKKNRRSVPSWDEILFGSKS